MTNRILAPSSVTVTRLMSRVSVSTGFWTASDSWADSLAGSNSGSFILRVGSTRQYLVAVRGPDAVPELVGLADELSGRRSLPERAGG